MILKNAKIILEDKIIDQGYIEIVNDKIYSIQEGYFNGNNGIDLSNHIIMPGFIDTHVHGGYNTSLEDVSNKSLNKFASSIAKEGVTRYCQATVTQTPKVMNAILSFYKEWMLRENKNPNQSRQLGLHIEGPFIAKEKKGAHSEELLIDADVNLVKDWIIKSGNNIKIITYAIEKDKNGELAKFLNRNKIVGSVGHTNCSAKEFNDIGFKNGSKRVTHLFNAMSQINHFTKGNGLPAGLVAAALYNDDVLCEIISDGVHLNDDVLKLIYKVKGQDGICLVTDAMVAKGLEDGDYKLGPLDVYKRGMAVKLKTTDNIAGSAATFDHCFRHFKEITNANYIEMAKMSSLNAAKNLGVSELLGSISVGKIADLVVMDLEHNIKMTIVEGKVVYKKDKNKK